MDMPCDMSSQQVSAMRGFSPPAEKRSLLATAFLPQHSLGERGNVILVPRRKCRDHSTSECIGETRLTGEDGLIASVGRTMTVVPPRNLTIEHASVIEHERELMRLLDGERAAQDLLANGRSSQG